jgi:predicted PurR-regulated permease PerM
MPTTAMVQAATAPAPTGVILTLFLAMFGVAGLMIGPVIAGLFVTVWDLYE